MDSDREERSRDFQRFITLIDAIAAIAITLLVLPLVDLATELDGGSVTGLLRDHETQIGAFLLSFVVIAACSGKPTAPGRTWRGPHPRRGAALKYSGRAGTAYLRR